MGPEKGVGNQLYSTLFETIAKEDIHRIVAGYTLPNPGSEALHRRFGFVPVGVFRENGRKFGRYWDVAWTERALRIDLSACAVTAERSRDTRARPRTVSRTQQGPPDEIYFTFLRIQSSMNLTTSSLFLSRNISCMLPWMPTSSRRTNSSWPPAWLIHLGMQWS